MILRPGHLYTLFERKDGTYLAVYPRIEDFEGNYRVEHHHVIGDYSTGMQYLLCMGICNEEVHMRFDDITYVPLLDRLFSNPGNRNIIRKEDDCIT